MVEYFKHSWEHIYLLIDTALNNWGGLHPIIVHFPIVLLLIAPLFILAGLFFSQSRKTLHLCALTTLITGTIGVYLAVTSGESASELLVPNLEYVTTLQKHYNLAHQSKIIFSVFSVIYALFLIFQSKLKPVLIKTFNAIFLISYMVSLSYLLNTAHYGGKLVHKHGLTSNLYSEK